MAEENQNRQVLKKTGTPKKRVRNRQRRRVRWSGLRADMIQRSLFISARRWTVRWDWARRWAHIRLSLPIYRSHPAGLNQQNPQSFRHECMQICRHGPQPEYKSLKLKMNQTGAENPENSDIVNISLRYYSNKRFRNSKCPPQTICNTKGASLGSVAHYQQGVQWLQVLAGHICF